MKILALHTNTGSRFYRIIPQLKWMQKQGHEVRLEKHDAEYLDQMIEWCDVLVMQSVWSEHTIKLAKKLGKKVLFETDDLLHRTHEKHYSWGETNTWMKRAKLYWMVFKIMRSVDAFICSNEDLKRVYGWMAKKTLVFPNYLELEHWLKEPKKNTTDKVRILWGGSTSHTGDLEWVKPIMKTILDKYPQSQFIYVGTGGVPTDDLYARFIFGDDIFAGIDQDRRESMLPYPPNVWPYVLASLQADIAIAPLEKNYFNKFKTQCKYLEYGVNALPGVYSKWFYTDVKDWTTSDTDKATGILADTPEQWIVALSVLIENATLRRTIGDNARAEVIEKYDFRLHAHEWQEFVENIAHEPTHLTSPSTQKVGG